MKKILLLIFLLQILSSAAESSRLSLRKDSDCHKHRSVKASKNLKRRRSNHKTSPSEEKEWMYFPDGDGNVKRAIMTYKDNNVTRRSTLVNSLTFKLYNRKNNASGGVEFQLKNMETVLPQVDNSKPLKVVTHGWMGNGLSRMCQDIKNAYLKKKDVNVIVMDWGKLAADVFYLTSVYNTKSAGEIGAKMIKKIVDNGMNPKNIHIIGHSLGAHASAAASSTLKKKENVNIGRVTGLDPALPFINFIAEKIDKNCADFVDVVHTCGGILGISVAVGHVDFYPNGGHAPQPRCHVDTLDALSTACSHKQSWILFKESIERSTDSYKCDSWSNFKSGKCKDATKVPFGDPVPSDARGSFYFST